MKLGIDRDLHVGELIPGPRIMMDSQAVIVDTTRTKLLKQANHAGSSGLMGFSEYCNID